jgi:Myo-inositol-1-phosphate synthase
MDSLHIMPGVWAADFIGESQHSTATHVAAVSADGASQQQRLDHLRSDIQQWRKQAGVTGHVTVIWSAR